MWVSEERKWPRRWSHTSEPGPQKEIETVDEVRITASGDPFYAADKASAQAEREECFYCLGSGYHFLGSIDAEGEEVVEAVACRRCEQES